RPPWRAARGRAPRQRPEHPLRFADPSGPARTPPRHPFARHCAERRPREVRGADGAGETPRRVAVQTAGRTLLIPSGTGSSMSQTRAVAVRVGASGYRAEITAGEHTLIADEPLSFGGTDQGPTPYDLLAASLGTCTAM